MRKHLLFIDILRAVFVSLGGTISAASEPGAGTTFTMRLRDFAG